MAKGVSTGIVVSHCVSNSAFAPLLPQVLKFIEEVAPEYREWTEVLSGLEKQALQERLRKIWGCRSSRLVVIDVGSSLEDANNTAEQLLRFSKADSNPETATIPAEELVGTLLCGAGNWKSFYGDTQRAESLPRGFPMPQQSWTFGSHAEGKIDFEGYIVGGFVCWKGRGLARVDARESVGQIGVRPGEGFLRLDQVVNELLSKIGAIPKFGA